ncbi:MAG: class I SAM-dependent methyltransferase [Lentisphaerae bacterium]|nr:class I SAM-dependent methyltransferase [Lentisphaerota bacterium]
MREAEPDTFPETADIETSSDSYAGRFTGAVGHWFLEVQAELTRSLLPPPPLSLLDVGGGHGQLAGPLCEAGYRLTVVGSSERCRNRIAPLIKAGQCQFMVGNLIALPFDANHFDGVLSFRLLSHCERWPKLIQELCRVSRGAVIVDYPAVQGLNRLAPALFDAKKKLEKNTRTWRNFQHSEIDQTFAEAGYRVTARQPQYALPMVLHRAMRCRRVSSVLEGALRGIGLTQRIGSPVIVKAEPTP